MEADDTEPSKTVSPFSDLYQMIRKSLDVKTPQKSSGNNIQMPTSKTKEHVSTKDTPKTGKVGAGDAAEAVTPKSYKKRRNSSQILASDTAATPENVKSEVASPQTRQRTTPRRYSASEVIEQICTPTLRSPMRRRSKEATPAKDQEEVMQSPNTDLAGVTGNEPKPCGSADLVMKKKRVSFGGYLVPEFFDKKLPPDSPLRKGDTPRRSLCLSKPKQSLLRRASVIGLENVADVIGSPKASGKKSPKGKSPSPGKKTPKLSTPSPNQKSPKSTSVSPKGHSSGKKSPKSKKPSPKVPKSIPVSPKGASPGKKSPKAITPSAKASPPSEKSPKSKSSSPKDSGNMSLKSRKPRRASSSINKLETPTTKKRTSLRPTPQENVIETPKAKTPLGSQMQVSSVQGRFSVSRIKTPSPIAEDCITTLSPTVTPKIPLRRKSLKSTSRKTPSLARSAAKVMLRRSGISRASMKVMSAWADTVKFGQPKVPAVAPAKNVVKGTSKARKVMNVSKLQTPVRKPLGHVSTGHANSPVTIIVGRAVKQKIILPAAAAPKVIFSAAISKKDLKMDEDLTGVSEMFKTPVNERKMSQQDKSVANKTPVGVVEPAVLEPSLLNTPEEPGEMMVSPLTAASTVKAGRYNKEAVKRLLNDDEESSFICDTSTLKTIYNPSEQQCTKMETSSVATPKQKPQLPESLTGVKRIMKTPRQNAEPVEDLRGRLLKTPKQKPEQQECLTGVKRIMKTPKLKHEPVEDLRGKLLKTPKQKHEQQECLTGVKRIMKTPKLKHEPVEDLRGKLLKTPKQKHEQQQCLTGVKRIMRIPRQKTEPIEDLRGKLQKTPRQKSEVADVSFSGLADLLETPVKKSQPAEANTETQKVDIIPVDCFSDVKRMTKTPKQRSAPVEDMLGIERLMKTPKERSQPVEENFGIKRLMKSPKLRGNAPVEDFEGLQDLMEEPLPDPIKQPETAMLGDQTTVSSGLDMAKERSFAAEQPQSDSGSSEIDISKGETTKVLVEVPSDSCEPSDAKEVICQAVVKEEAPVVRETATMHSATSKKPIRGRRAKTVESKADNDKQEMVEPSQDPVPVRGRRGRKAEPTEPTRDVVEPAREEARVAPKPKRGRGAIKVSKQIETVEEAAAESLPEPESRESGGDAPLEKEAMKPKRGRKPKQLSLQSKHDDVAQEGDGDKLELTSSKHDQNMPSEVDVAAEKDVTIVQKSVRGRKGKLVEKSRAAEDKQEAACEEAVVSAPVRPRRGKRTEVTVPPAGRQTTRSTKAKEDSSVAQPKIVENMEPVTSADSVNNVTASTTGQEEVKEPAEESLVKPSRDRKAKQEAKPQDPVKKSRSSRKGGEPLVSELENISPQDPAVARTRHVGVRKTKQEAANVTSDESIENQDGPIEMPTEKPKRSRRAKQVEDVGTSEVPEEMPAQKPQRGRGVKTNLKDDISQVVPAKRARRGAAVTGKEAKKVEALVTVPKLAPASVEPVKRGRLAAAKASSESNATDYSNDVIAEHAKTSQRSVRWKMEVEVHEIPKATPVKAVRGRKSRLADEAEPQPAKRTRRGAKAANEAESTNKAEETLPKTRRGRPAKK
ncbi:proliferation marker protein Ki-67 isoform X2 [Dunckerocampus dactyliophorus]|nr:proliferation marker protein Ki-67 isoform X2 [Dunckerocampus dactyliophorus]XP_054623034.1 proliferation marker protein Ki-67 isoform X2 [Dunckerocampus dactyliophorus]